MRNKYKPIDYQLIVTVLLTMENGIINPWIFNGRNVDVFFDSTRFLKYDLTKLNKKCVIVQYNLSENHPRGRLAYPKDKCPGQYTYFEVIFDGKVGEILSVFLLMEHISYKDIDEEYFEDTTIDDVPLNNMSTLGQIIQGGSENILIVPKYRYLIATVSPLRCPMYSFLSTNSRIEVENIKTHSQINNKINPRFNYPEFPNYHCLIYDMEKQDLLFRTIVDTEHACSNPECERPKTQGKPYCYAHYK